MANTKNLKSNSERTPKERKELAQKAGMESGKARRERKQLKEELLLLLSEGDTQKRLSLALINKALSGDIRAFETIRDTIGEKPTDKQEISNTNAIPKIVVANENVKAKIEKLMECARNIDDSY